jgi:predicted PurR-regulated permease PerM
VYLITRSDWFLVFFVTLILSFIPVIGAAPMAFLFAIVAFFQGNPTGAIILLVLGGFTGVIDNFLRPWLASFGHSHAPPIVSFVFVIGGALTLGFPGLFIGLLLGGIVYDTLPLFWEELAKGPDKKGLLDSLSLPDRKAPCHETRQ